MTGALSWAPFLCFVAGVVLGIIGWATNSERVYGASIGCFIAVTILGLMWAIARGGM